MVFQMIIGFALLSSDSQAVFTILTIVSTLLMSLLFIPVSLWQGAILIHNVKKLFKEGSSTIGNLGHMFDMEAIQANLRSSFMYTVVVGVIYSLPIWFLSIISTLLSAPTNFHNSQALSGFRSGDLDSFTTYSGVSTTPGAGIALLCVSLLTLIYTLFLVFVIQPAVLNVGIKHGFKATLSPSVMWDFISKHAGDLGYLALVTIIVFIAFFIAAIVSGLLVFLCIGFLLLPFVVILMGAYQLYIMPGLYAQAWGEKK